MSIQLKCGGFKQISDYSEMVSMYRINMFTGGGYVSGCNGFNGFVSSDGIWYIEGRKPFKYAYILTPDKPDRKPFEISVDFDNTNQ